ncbi:MAG: hypothetical protein BM557_04175 [Flavobacterium sp. MedPE-SWcel]|uniref:hypothetical protein n=1 Tax=uncultured Flavobacterium sp. TaxID=165435 RepID=UPI00091D605B|nr:hypothetical protein [uncultured Flavobacterium sp.]OIQ21455.1 MAG: hypothetical protein BM557_04175 [Flavobacterium sp. MedPE-SWcel]
MVKNKVLEIVIICLLWVSVILSFVLILDYDIQFAVGILGLLIVSLTLKKYYKLSIQLLLLLLLLSVFEIVKFSIAFGVKFGSVNLISMFLLGMIIVKRLDVIRAVMRSSSIERGNNEKERRRSSVEFFKRQFSNLSVQKLEGKLRDDDLVEEAKQAVELLLNEKKD